MVDDRTPDTPPSMLDVSAAEGICSDTANGWLWYCDVHDTHGNADSSEEAGVVADAHSEYWEDPENEDCHIVVWQRTPHERLG